MLSSCMYRLVCRKFLIGFVVVDMDMFRGGFTASAY